MLQKDPFIMKLQDLIAVFDRIDDCRRQSAVPEGQLRSGACLFPRARQALPFAVSEIAQEHDLHGAARAARSHQARRQNTRVIQHEAITLLQKRRKIVKVLMLDCSRISIQYQESGCVALFKRGLRDQLLG